jgi:hypothetical protein
MNFTPTAPLKYGQTTSLATPVFGPRAEAIPPTAQKPEGEPPLSPSEAAQEEHEKSIAHTMPDDPVGDFA